MKVKDRSSTIPQIFPWQKRTTNIADQQSNIENISPNIPTSLSTSPLQATSPIQPTSPLQPASPLQTTSPIQPTSPLQPASPLQATLPLQRTSPTTEMPTFCPACIIYHDHNYSEHIQCHTHGSIPSQSMLSCNIGSEVSLLSSRTLNTCNKGSQVSSSNFCIETFVNDDAAIKIYTGFDNYQLLDTCFQFLGEAVNHLKYWGKQHSSTSIEKRGTSRSLTPINEFFLVLCRLRCGLMERDLAYRFGISQPTVSRTLITWINFIYFKFKEINIWPSKQQIVHFMPQIFKEFYPSTRCIIDATEIFIQSPSDPQAQQLTFSSYKNHNTFKALVCITPSGAISFVSKLYGGSISDRELTVKSGVLDLLEAGDSVMVDKGFTIADLVEVKGVTLNIPPMKLNDQFSETELLSTRRIASLRIHVERAIGQIKNYRILNDIPNNMARIADQIFYVCSMLCNFTSPLCTKQ